MGWLWAMRGGVRIGVILLALFVVYLSMSVVPAGHVGVQDFFGRVSDRILAPGINLVVPGTRVVKFSVQTREMKETAAVPTSEGLVVNLDVSLLFRLQPEAAARVYKTIGQRFEAVVIDPQLRSIIRDVTAEYEAKFLYSASREVVARTCSRAHPRRPRPARDRGGAGAAPRRPAAGSSRPRSRRSYRPSNEPSACGSC